MILLEFTAVVISCWFVSSITTDTATSSCSILLGSLLTTDALSTYYWRHFLEEQQKWLVPPHDGHFQLGLSCAWGNGIVIGGSFGTSGGVTVGSAIFKKFKKFKKKLHTATDNAVFF